jgi:2-polyprenyl-6-hydroxyphenyl methylase / 3-demethylubiquinone-9 3-methyltransferase
MQTLPKYISFLKENRTLEQAKEIYHQRIEDSQEVYNKFVKDFITRDCPICGSNEHEELERFNGQYGVVSCAKCASMFVNPSPNLEALDFYYNHCKCNEQLGSLLKERVGKKSIILSERTATVLGQIQDLLTKKPEVRVLEVGCNSGVFLCELKEALAEKQLAGRVTFVGIDIDEKAIGNPVDTDLTLFHSSAENFVEQACQSFDLILHFELVEHLHNPFDFCRALYGLLNDGGLMYFHTPNAIGLDNQALSYNDFRPLAHGIFPPMHLNAFTTQNVGHFLIRCGFNVKSIQTPGNFDVDIVRQFCENDNEFSIVKEIKDEAGLAIIQHLLRNLGCSSHLAVLAAK